MSYLQRLIAIINAALRGDLVTAADIHQALGPAVERLQKLSSLQLERKEKS